MNFTKLDQVCERDRHCMMVFMLLGHLSGFVAATGLNSLAEAEAELRFHSFVLKFFDFVKFKQFCFTILFA